MKRQDIPSILASSREAGRPNINRIQLVVVLAVGLAVSSCTFDRSGLADKRECTTAWDCPGEAVCIGGRCVADIDTGADVDDLGILDGRDFDAADSDPDAITDAIGSDVPSDDIDEPDAVDLGFDTEDLPIDCPDGNNACGGCEELFAEPGDPCGGECGAGVWACASHDTVTCLSDDVELNACGGCLALDADPGTPCSECGAEWHCVEGGESVACEGPLENTCGGCDALIAEPDTACGPCGDGTYTCTEDGEAVECLNAGSLNACGGCTPLEGYIGDPCGDCGGLVCASSRESLICADPGVNACDGCGELAGVPTESCGICHDGNWTCDEGGASVTCADATPPNGCGGCGVLDGEPDEGCGVCDDGHYVCSSDNSAVECVDATPANGCGGCGELEGEPTTSCGDCDDGEWTCSDDLASVTCENASTLNACGGCGVLDGVPEAICGDCDDGVWTCSDDLASVTCEGASALNACDLCGTLSGTPGDACSCSEAGDATWVCSTDDVVCIDGDDDRNDATDLGTFAENESTSASGWVDAVGDWDWYTVAVTDVFGPILEPQVSLTSSTSATPGINYDLCVFYEYASNVDITNYNCPSGDDCVYFDGSANAVINSSCNGSDSFDASQDRYGCCDDDYDADGFAGWRVRLTGVEGLGDNGGTAHVLVRTNENTRPEGCDSYSLSISF